MPRPDLCRTCWPIPVRRSTGACFKRPSRHVHDLDRLWGGVAGYRRLMTFTAVGLIETKRDRGTLSPEAIDWLIRSYTEGTVADYQMAAMAMAVFLNGLDAAELAAWTDAMLHSGDVLDCSGIPAAKVDKHSTGGVGDKISIPLAPLVAACGVAVPMMSGRGLGHTGGTLDKLESIPGFTTGLDPERFRRGARPSAGWSWPASPETLVPADRKLYALRDATATVASIPLISSSIMSKKLAEGLDGLVLDVKIGSGAFMQDLDRARELARTMVGIGDRHGVKTMALITRMDQPLGREVGNSNEIRESIDVLRGEGPQDVVELTLAFGEVMLELGGVEGGRSRLMDAIASGAALQKLADVVEAQGGDPAVIHDPSLLPAGAARRCHRGRYRRLRDPMRCPDRRHGRHPARCRTGAQGRRGRPGGWDHSRGEGG